jgi:AAA ATPase domain/Zinc-binding dehydrogenase
VERPFIGRSGELEQIVDLIASPRVTTAAVVLGDPGVGKSRLLEEVTSATGGWLLPVIGYESERLVPLAASADLLRALASVPGFGDALDEMLFRGPSGAEPVRVLELAHRALAGSGPALIIVDDLQWLDDLSLALVHYLLRGAAAADTAVRLLAAGRPVAGSMGFAEEVAQLLGPRSLVVELAPLGIADAVELGLSLDPEMGRDQALTLAERSRGFPFWIETLVRSGEHAPDVDRLVTGRLRTATPDAAPLLAILAVASRPLASEDAAELMGWPMARIERTVEELAARGLGSHVVGGIQPSHDLVREAVLVQLSEAERRRLHLRLATWLEGHAGERVSLLREALDHRVAAGEQPVELASRLVSSPRRRLLGVAGLASIAGVANTTLPTDEAGQALHAGLASLAYELGEYALALQCWAVLGEELRDATASQDILRGLGAAEVVETITGDFDLIVEGVGGATFGRAIEHVAPRGVVVNIATQSDDETVTFRAAEFDRAKGASIYTLNLFDELAHVSAASDLDRLCRLMADGRLDGQIEFEGSWGEAAQALNALLERRIGGKAVLHVD